jgi:hypothetical protein
MVRVRFASSPGGSLSLGDALSAVASRRFADEHGGVLLLRIDNTAIRDDLAWLGVRWDEDEAPPRPASAVDDLDAGIADQGSLLGAPSVAELRDAGYPAEAVRAYLDELGLPRHDVQFDEARLRRLSIEALAALSDDELAARVGVPAAVVPAMRGARDLREARQYAEQVLEPAHTPVDAPETIARLAELVAAGGLDGRSIVRELQAVGGDLKAVRRALTGSDRGPELAAVIDSLSRDELLNRLEA